MLKVVLVYLYIDLVQVKLVELYNLAVNLHIKHLLDKLQEFYFSVSHPALPGYQKGEGVVNTNGFCNI